MKRDCGSDLDALAGAIHDLRNSLSVMLNECELLLMRLEPDHPAAEHARELHAAGQDAAKHAAILVTLSRNRGALPADE